MKGTSVDDCLLGEIAGRHDPRDQNMHDPRPVSGVEGSLDVVDGSAGVRLGLGLLPRAVHGLGVERLRD